MVAAKADIRLIDLHSRMSLYRCVAAIAGKKECC